MKSHAFHILCALAAGDAHGSGIARLVREQSGGTVKLWPVTLYGTLDDLVEQGLIAELDGNERPAGASRRRRFYRLSDAGARSLTEEAARLETVAREALENVADGSWRR